MRATIKNNQIDVQIRWRKKRRRKWRREVDRNQRVSPHLIEMYLVKGKGSRVLIAHEGCPLIAQEKSVILILGCQRHHLGWEVRGKTSVLVHRNRTTYP